VAAPGAQAGDSSEADNSSALQRLRETAETNLLVWIRTCLAMMGFGFVLARFGLFLSRLAALDRSREYHPPGFSMAAGTGLIVMGVVFLSAAVFLHWRLVDRLNRGEHPELSGRWSLGVLAAVVLIAAGLVLAGYLAFIG
jgi:putative membrane protein